MPEVRSGNTSGTKQTPKENPLTYTDPSVKPASKPIRQMEGTRRIWLSTYHTDTPNFSESSKNDRLANVIITMNTRVGYREPGPIWNRFEYNRYLPGPKCNADFGASFRCLSQLKTVARQIPCGTCKTAPAPNVNFVLCRSRSLVFSSQQA